MKSLHTSLSLLVAVCLLTSCIPAAEPQLTNLPQNTEVPSATFEPVGGIAITPTQSITPIPPPTRRVATLVTATATITPLPSFTIAPTSKNTKTVTSTITGTNTLFVVPPGFGRPTVSATPQPFKCEVVRSSPKWGEVYTPRENFIASWKLQNTGANMWHKDDILDGYVSGTKMQNRERGNRILDFTVYKGDYLNIQLQMVPPKEPGLYTTTWGLRKTNKKEFFCEFSVTIQVVRKK